MNLIHMETQSHFHLKPSVAPEERWAKSVPHNLVPAKQRKLPKRLREEEKRALNETQDKGENTLRKKYCKDRKLK